MHLTGDYQTIEGLTLEGQGGVGFSGSGVGIRIRRTGDSAQFGSTRIVYRACIRDCEIASPNSWGIKIDNTPRDNEAQISVWAIYDNLEIHHPGQGGCVDLGEADSTTQYFKNCNFKDCNGIGVLAKNVPGISLLDCIIEKGGPSLKLETCDTASIAHCWFEGRYSSGPWVEFLGTSRGVEIATCVFAKNGGSPADNDLQGIRIGSNCRSVSIANPYLALPGDASMGSGQQILIDAGAEVVVVGGRLADGVSADRWPQIADNASRTILLGSGARVRLPRISTTERDGGSLPPWKAGDMLFNSTTSKAQVYDGTSWNDLW